MTQASQHHLLEPGRAEPAQRKPAARAHRRGPGPPVVPHPAVAARRVPGRGRGLARVRQRRGPGRPRSTAGRPATQPSSPTTGPGRWRHWRSEEPSTPDLRTAVELGQALERRLTASGLPGTVVDSLRRAFPVRAGLGPEQAARSVVVRFLRVCGGRATDGIAALAAARAAAPALPSELVLPAGVAVGAVVAVLARFVDWALATFGPIGQTDAGGLAAGPAGVRAAGPSARRRAASG